MINLPRSWGITTRLRRIARSYAATDYTVAVNLDEAADEIKHLTEEVARLRQVLLTVSMHATDIHADRQQLLNEIAATLRAALPREEVRS